MKKEDVMTTQTVDEKTESQEEESADSEKKEETKESEEKDSEEEVGENKDSEETEENSEKEDSKEEDSKKDDKDESKSDDDSKKVKKVGKREDSEGFILDYFKEEFIINESDVENRSVSLKVTPCDPIRELVIDEVEYIEDIDFTVDYLNNTIIFPIIDINESATILNDNLGKEMHIVYTPNLEDSGLILAYRGVRKNTDKQMRIIDNYIEYKV